MGKYYDINGQEITEAECNTLKASGKRFKNRDGDRYQFIAQEETARDAEEAQVLVDKPMNDWVDSMREFKMSRELEDHITDHHAGNAGNAYAQARYDEKIWRRSEKP